MIAPMLMLAMLAGITSVVFAKPQALHTSMRTFLTNYIMDAGAGHYTPESNLNVPAAWLYSQDGQFIAIAHDVDAIDVWEHHLPTAPPAHSSGQPSLAAISKVLKDARAGTLVAAPGRSTILLFLTNSPGCTRCASFEHATDRLAHNHGKGLRIVTVILTVS